jgi:hypothetical protein
VVDEVTPVSKEALEAAITEANGAMVGVAVSADGTDVDIGTEWVTQGDLGTLNDAITAAQAVFDDEAASQGQVDEALSALTGALDTFNGAIKDGLKADKTTLSAAITTANEAKAGVVPSTDGTDIDIGTYWVIQGDLDTLNTAIAAAQTVADNLIATPAEIVQAVTTLNAAVTTFNGAKKDGLKADKTALSAAITTANEAKAGVVVAAAATDVFSIFQWVTQGTLDTLNAAIAAAQTVVDNPIATPADIVQAINTLNAAVTTFNGAKQPGTKAADTAAITAAITAANAAKDGVVVNTAAANVFSGIEWVSQGALDTLNAAIAAAQTVADNLTATPAEIVQAINTLNAAVTVFNGAKQTGSKAAELALHYDFNNVSNDTIPDLAGGDHPGTLADGATVDASGTVAVMYTSTGNGYVDLGANTGLIITDQDAYTVSAYVNTNGSLSGNGWFPWMFSNIATATSSGGSYIYFRAANTKYVLSLGGWNNETAVSRETMLARNVWKHVLIRQTLYDAEIFIDGVKVAGGKVNIRPSSLAADDPLIYNYLAKPCFTGDNYMKDTKFADFRIYRGALSDAGIGALNIGETLVSLNGYNVKEMVDSAANWGVISLGNTSAIGADIALPQGDAFVNVNWSSSNPGVVSSTGAVTRPAADTTVTLTGIFSAAVGEPYSVTKTVEVKVLRANAVFEDFLIAKLEVNEQGQLVNTAPTGTAFNPTLQGTASVVSSTVGETVYKAVNTGSSGYIDLGPKLGALLLNTQWTIEFYINTPSDAGDMLAFANEETPASRGTVRFHNPALWFRTHTAGTGGTTTGLGGSGGLGSARTNRWVHLTLVRDGNYVGIYRNGGVAQNNQGINFSALTTDPIFGADPAVSSDPLRFGYLGKTLTGTAVANVQFYGFKAYAAAIVPITADRFANATLDGGTTTGADASEEGTPITWAMRQFKAALNAAFGLADSSN